MTIAIPSSGSSNDDSPPTQQLTPRRPEKDERDIWDVLSETECRKIQSIRIIHWQNYVNIGVDRLVLSDISVKDKETVVSAISGLRDAKCNAFIADEAFGPSHDAELWFRFRDRDFRVFIYKSGHFQVDPQFEREHQRGDFFRSATLAYFYDKVLRDQKLTPLTQEQLDKFSGLAEALRQKETAKLKFRDK